MEEPSLNGEQEPQPAQAPAPVEPMQSTEPAPAQPAAPVETQTPSVPGAPAPVEEAASLKKKMMVAGLVVALVVGAVAGGFYLFKATGTSLTPPSLELNAKATQGFIKDQKTGFMVPTEEDRKCFEAAKKAANSSATQLKTTAMNKGMHYVYWDEKSPATFKDLGCNTDPTKAKMEFMAQWDTINNYFTSSPHNYYKNEKDGETLIKVVDAKKLDTVSLSTSGGVIFASVGHTETYGFKDGNTFAKNPYGICDASKANGWHLFASHTKSAKELLKDCKEGKIKSFNIQTSVSPVKFKKGNEDDTLTYSMVWVLKGDAAKVSVPDKPKVEEKPKIEEDAAAKKAAADKAAADKAAADKAAADKAAADKAAADKAAADKAAADKADHKYTLLESGSNLKVAFNDGENITYSISKSPDTTIIKPVIGEDGFAQDDAFVKAFTKENKYIGYFEFGRNDKKFSAKINNEFNGIYTLTEDNGVISVVGIPGANAELNDDSDSQFKQGKEQIGRINNGELNNTYKVENGRLYVSSSSGETSDYRLNLTPINLKVVSNGDKLTVIDSIGNNIGEVALDETNNAKVISGPLEATAGQGEGGLEFFIEQKVKLEYSQFTLSGDSLNIEWKYGGKSTYKINKSPSTLPLEVVLQNEVNRLVAKGENGDDLIAITVKNELEKTLNISNLKSNSLAAAHLEGDTITIKVFKNYINDELVIFKTNEFNTTSELQIGYFIEKTSEGKLRIMSYNHNAIVIVDPSLVIEVIAPNPPTNGQKVYIMDQEIKDKFVMRDGIISDASDPTKINVQYTNGEGVTIETNNFGIYKIDGKLQYDYIQANELFLRE